MFKRIFVLLIALPLCSVAAYASKIGDDLARELKGKIVILREFPTASHVRFDKNGTPVGHIAHGYWTSDGMVQIQNVSVKGNELRLKGRRVVNLFDNEKGAFSNLSIKQDFEADLQLDPSWQDVNALKPLLDAVILRDPKGLVELVPDYWKACFEGIHKVGEKWQCGRAPNTRAEISKTQVSPIAVQASRIEAAAAASTAGTPAESKSASDQPNEEDAKGSADAKVVMSPAAPDSKGEATMPPGLGKQVPAETGSGVYKVGKGVTAPKPEYTPDPSYSEGARKARFQGTTLLWIVISPQGEVEWVKISRPLGAGLDDKAVEAVKRWKFRPATLNGEPVKVMVNVEVNFHLY